MRISHSRRISEQRALCADLKARQTSQAASEAALIEQCKQLNQHQTIVSQERLERTRLLDDLATRERKLAHDQRRALRQRLVEQQHAADKHVVKWALTREQQIEVEFIEIETASEAGRTLEEAANVRHEAWKEDHFHARLRTGSLLRTVHDQRVCVEDSQRRSQRMLLLQDAAGRNSKFSAFS